jgi:hypothetical protein
VVGLFLFEDEIENRQMEDVGGNRVGWQPTYSRMRRIELFRVSRFNEARRWEWAKLIVNIS